MAEIINLRRARKDKQRKEQSAIAEGNRLKFGRTKQERKRTDAEKSLQQKRLDGHKLDSPASED